MRLNPNCIRAVLLYVEENAKFTTRADSIKKPTNIVFHDLYNSPELKKFSEDDVYYSVLKLFEGQYISGTLQLRGNVTIMYCDIDGITLEGHDLLDNIRDNSVWNKTKESLSGVASVSLKIMSKVAGAVAAEYVKAMM